MHDCRSNGFCGVFSKDNGDAYVAKLACGNITCKHCLKKIKSQRCEIVDAIRKEEMELSGLYLYVGEMSREDLDRFRESTKRRISRGRTDGQQVAELTLCAIGTFQDSLFVVSSEPFLNSKPALKVHALDRLKYQIDVYNPDKVTRLDRSRFWIMDGWWADIKPKKHDRSPYRLYRRCNVRLKMSLLQVSPVVPYTFTDGNYIVPLSKMIEPETALSDWIRAGVLDMRSILSRAYPKRL